MHISLVGHLHIIVFRYSFALGFAFAKLLVFAIFTLII